MRIEVICTGDEVLTGKIVNSNFSYISQKLEDFGLSLTWETTVGDDRDELLLAFQLAGQRADAVIVNGGLGPTVDDLSQEIAAKAAGVGLELNEAWMATMEAFFAKRLRQMPPNNKKQAMLPVGAEVLDSPGLRQYPPAPRAYAPPYPYYVRGKGTQYSAQTNSLSSERLGTQFYSVAKGYTLTLGNRAGLSFAATGRATT